MPIPPSPATLSIRYLPAITSPTSGRLSASFESGILDQDRSIFRLRSCDPNGARRSWCLSCPLALFPSCPLCAPFAPPLRPVLMSLCVVWSGGLHAKVLPSRQLDETRGRAARLGDVRGLAVVDVDRARRACLRVPCGQRGRALEDGA